MANASFRPRVRGGTALVCGAAATLTEDYERATEMRPDATVIGVNDVSEVLKLDHLFTLDPEKVGKWHEWQTRLFGWGYLAHSNRAADGIDVSWPEIEGKGTSAWAAAKMARLMGFEEVILCGAPLDPVPYVKRGPAQAFVRPKMLDTHRSYVAADTEPHDVIRSMSGWTREVLGAPV